MTDLGQFQEPFAEVPLGPVEPNETQPEPDSDSPRWWVNEDEETR